MKSAIQTLEFRQGRLSVAVVNAAWDDGKGYPSSAWFANDKYVTRRYYCSDIS